MSGTSGLGSCFTRWTGLGLGAGFAGSVAAFSTWRKAANFALKSGFSVSSPASATGVLFLASSPVSEAARWNVASLLLNCGSGVAFAAGWLDGDSGAWNVLSRLLNVDENSPERRFAAAMADARLEFGSSGACSALDSRSKIARFFTNSSLVPKTTVGSS